MKLTIPIQPDTLDLIQAINNDIRPEIEAKPTYFVIDITDASVDIIAQAEIDNIANAWEYATPVHVGYID